MPDKQKRKATAEEIRDGWWEIFGIFFAEAAVWLAFPILASIIVAVFNFFGAGIKIFDVGTAAGLLVLLVLCAGWYYPSRIMLRWLRRRIKSKPEGKKIGDN